MLSALRSTLDCLYRLCGGIAAVFMCLILVIIVAQMLARWTGHIFPGATDYAGYCMAASAFFAMAYALNHGAHIRVSLLLEHLGRARRWGELWCFAVASVIGVFFAWHAVKGTYLSWKLHDISQGQDAWPLWIPQISMSIGTVVLAIALLDHLVQVAVVGRSGIDEGAPGEGAAAE